MNTYQTIRIPSGTTYINEVLTELPRNCIFDKGRVGCGGTTIALENDDNYIVVVPFVHLAESKSEHYQGKVFSYTGSTTSNELKAYLETYPVKKILVTYDSFENLIKVTGTNGYKLLVDECHQLFTAYSFRNQAVKKVLNNYKLFDYYTLMTATVLEDEFILDELKDLPVVIAQWEDIPQVTIRSYLRKGNTLTPTIANMIRNYLRGSTTGNAYIFVNSVRFIKEMVSLCRLTDENTRAVWSKFREDAEVGLLNSNPSDAPKKINFFTSTCFEGVDLYDPDGRIYIISDSYRENTLVDISTSFHQIAGRIRNSKHKNMLTHVFSNTEKHNVHITYKQYREQIQDDIAEVQQFVDDLNKFPDKYRTGLNSDEVYISKEGNKFIVDSNLIRYDLYNFKITKHLYQSRSTLKEEAEKNGFKVQYVHVKGNFNQDDIKPIEEEITKLTFKQVVQRLKSEEGNLLLRFDMDDAIEKYPFLVKAIKTLGFEGIDKLKYNITNIKKKLIAVSGTDEHNKIVKLLEGKTGICPGSFAPAAYLKTTFSDIYELLGSEKTGKGTDIQNYYTVKETVKTIRGVSVKGYVLMSRKLIVAA